MTKDPNSIRESKIWNWYSTRFTRWISVSYFWSTHGIWGPLPYSTRGRMGYIILYFASCVVVYIDCSDLSDHWPCTIYLLILNLFCNTLLRHELYTFLRNYFQTFLWCKNRLNTQEIILNKRMKETMEHKWKENSEWEKEY